MPADGENRHSGRETFPGLMLLRFEGRAYFANAQRVGDKLRALAEERRPAVVVLDMSAVPDLEYSALKMLDEGERKHAANGIEVWLAALNPSVRAMVMRSALGPRLGERRMFATVEQAVAAYEKSDLTRRA